MSARAFPCCQQCNYPLLRVDHVAVEHSIWDDGEYRPVNVEDGNVHGGWGLASDVDLWCGRCGQPLTREQRAYFYQRWIYVKEFNR